MIGTLIRRGWFMERLSRFRGALLGLAAGDALGTTLEFEDPGTFEPIDDIVDGGPFELKPGEWTDDTTMALCLVESLVECRGFDLSHQLKTYCRWLNHGHLSCRGRCFDIGMTTHSALSHFERTGNPFSGPTHSSSSGNGSIMRLAPVPLYFASNLKEAILKSADSSRTTHGTRECIDACRYMGAVIVGALDGRPKSELLGRSFWQSLGVDEPLAPKIAEIVDGSFREKEPPEIAGAGYVVKSLEAALWAFYKSEDFRHGALLAVNLGVDADTTGAVYGQIAGAYYGEDGIPPKWRAKLAMRELIVQRADDLCALSQA